MSFSLNAPWTDVEVSTLLASVPDTHNSRLVVYKTGLVDIINTDIAPTPYASLHAYFETYQAGNGYAGPSAAADAEHVSDIADKLRKNWPNLQGDAYLDH